VLWICLAKESWLEVTVRWDSGIKQECHIDQIEAYLGRERRRGKDCQVQPWESTKRGWIHCWIKVTKKFIGNKIRVFHQLFWK